ncbi:MAG: GntR family transcriptional regulator, partial [bacterium]
MSRNRQQTRTLKQAAKQIARMPGVRGRRNGRADAIAHAIRNHIVAGELRPGDQVPPRRELEAMFNTGANT